MIIIEQFDGVVMSLKPNSQIFAANKETLLVDALAAFESQTNIKTQILKINFQLPEGLVDAKIKLGNNPAFMVEIKPTIRPVTLDNTIQRLQRIPKPAILITNFVSPQQALQLRKLDIPFIDIAGNIFLKTTNTLIYVVGNKEIKRAQSNTIRAFRAKGLQVIFALLCDPELIKAPYREIADKSGVALGTITNVIKDLKLLGFLYRSRKKGLVLENTKKLITQWADAYPRELRPHLKSQRFKVIEPDWWQETNFSFWEKNNLWLGGEPAAALLTKYLQPELITLYGNPDIKTLAHSLSFERNSNGNIELMEPFWNFEITQTINLQYRLCPPLLVYADLLATGQARQLETAEYIMDKYLANSQ